ncbi:MAG: hypothetical protein Q8Q39_04490, partial [bacterium]|nr:hypothetical protein [bacterium]
MRLFLKKIGRARIFFAYALLVAVGALALFAPWHAYAADPLGLFAGIAAEGVANIISVITSILIHIIGLFVPLAIGLLEILLEWSSFQNVPIVEIGWAVARDFVNLLFILILLVIGFATIFRRENFGIKRLLPRLIFVALLINFSKVIAAFVLDIGNLLTFFFLNPIQGGEGSLGTALMNVFNLQKVFDTGSILSAGVHAGTTDAIKMAGFKIFGSLLSVMMMLMAVIGLLLYSVTFLYRVVMLWFLIILAPFAWIAYILPGTQGYWKKWWDQFICWTFVAPIMVFFLFLLAAWSQNVTTYGLTSSIDAINPNDVKNGILTESGACVSVMSCDLRFMLQYVILILMLYAGPFAAKSMGCAGSQMAMSAAAAGNAWVMGTTGRAGRAGARYGYDRAKERIAPQMQKAGDWLASSPLAQSRLGRALGVGALARAGVQAGESNRAAVQTAMKKYQSLSTAALIATAQTKGGLNQTDRIALATLMAQRRDIHEQDADKRAYVQRELSSVIDVGRAKRDYELIKPLLAVAPQFAKDSAELARAVREAFRTGAHKNWGPEVFRSAANVAMLDQNGNPITDAAGNPALKNASALVIQSLYEELGENSESIKRYGEQLGKKERDALVEGLKTTFTTGDDVTDF